MKHSIREHIVDPIRGKVVKVSTINAELGSGITDCNGKEIFEGDIVKCTHCGEFRTVIFDEKLGSFEFDSKDPVKNPDGSCLCCDHDSYEVIGHIKY